MERTEKFFTTEETEVTEAARTKRNRENGEFFTTEETEVTEVIPYPNTSVTSVFRNLPSVTPVTSVLRKPPLHPLPLFEKRVHPLPRVHTLRCLTSEEVPHPEVPKIAVPEAPDDVAAVADEPSDRPFEREVVPQGGRRDAPHEAGTLGRVGDTE